MRRLTFLFLAFVMIATLHAQVILRYGAEIDAGYGAANVITPYVSFPSLFMYPYTGNKITKVRIGLNKDATNVYLYFKENPRDGQPIYRQKIDSLSKGWNEIVLDTPFDIDGTKNIAIGYKASFSEPEGVGYSLEYFSDGDYIYNNSSNSWTSTGGSICIHAIVEGDNMPQNEMLIGRMQNQKAPYDAETMTFRSTVRNVGANQINSYQLRYTFDEEEQTMFVEKTLEVNATDTFAITVPSSVIGTHLLAVTIDQVNGTADAYDKNNTVSATLTVKDKRFQRRVVCEEYTGNWCGWCPRGMVGLELMKETYPETFFAVSIHGGQGDPVEIDPESAYSYSQWIYESGKVPGAPYCTVNRRLSGDPYGDIGNFYTMETLADNHIAYTMTATWNADSTAISVLSTFFSDIDIENPDYYIAYAVTEDSLYGDAEKGYVQTNYYAGGGNGELDGWELKDRYTTDFVWNDVARGIFSGYEGVPARNEKMIAQESYYHNYIIPLPAAVENKKYIHVIGQIMNHSTGYIENAFSCTPVAEEIYDEIVTFPVSAVHITRQGDRLTVAANSDYILTVFNTLGQMIVSKRIGVGNQKISVPAEGILVVKISDGVKNLRTFKLK